jgi:hypothetical protein
MFEETTDHQGTHREHAVCWTRDFVQVVTQPLREPRRINKSRFYCVYTGKEKIKNALSITSTPALKGNPSYIKWCKSTRLLHFFAAPSPITKRIIVTWSRKEKCKSGIVKTKPKVSPPFNLRRVYKSGPWYSSRMSFDNSKNETKEKSPWKRH